MYIIIRYLKSLCRFGKICIALWDVTMSNIQCVQYSEFNTMLRETCEFMFQNMEMLAWTSIILLMLHKTCWRSRPTSRETQEGHVNPLGRFLCTYSHGMCGGHPFNVAWTKWAVAYIDMKSHETINACVIHINNKMNTIYTSHCSLGHSKHQLRAKSKHVCRSHDGPREARGVHSMPIWTPRAAKTCYPYITCHR